MVNQVSTYILRRFLQSLLVVWLLSVVVFLLMRLLPGDPVLMLITAEEFEAASEERLALLRKEFGLDQPLPVQYVRWLWGLVTRGDLGISIIQRVDVRSEIAKRLPISLHIGVTALVVGGVVGVFLGIVSALRRGTWLDTLVTFIANIGITAPSFWLAILFIYIFGLRLRWLPIFGYTSPFEDFWMSFRQSVMPVIVLATLPMAALARQARSSMLEVLRQDYIRTARAKGVVERQVISKHALKNALIPVVTIAGLLLNFVIGGTVVIETVFNIPGLGRLAVDSVVAKDYPVVQGFALLTGITTTMITLMVDLMYGFLDPRIRYG